MSSIKNLKKSINNQIGEFIEEIYNWELLNPNKDLSKSEKLIDDSIKIFDSLIFKINSVNKENSKKEFKSINDERVKLWEELNKKFSKL
tara:strand:- start:152 stop:418 length:267 start_codon:yes stop_codon:yes gene_type:complete